MEILEDIIGGLILINLLVATTWSFIFSLLKGKKSKKTFIIVNIVIYISYMAYCLYGRFNWSDYGNTLVWEFYAVVLPLAQTFILLISALVLKKYGRSVENKST